MKKLLILFVLIATNIYSQEFEGVVKWKATMEFTDPAMKAQVDNAAKQMSDPAFQAQMAELKKQMDTNPQMKAMMESNPQMKAMMDRMANGGASGATGIIPTGMIFKMKKGNVLTTMQGGVMADMETLFVKEKGQSFTIDRKNKTYSVLASGSDSKSTSNSNAKVTKTNQTAKILNYNCTLYTAEVVEKGRTITQKFWTTTEIKDWDMKAMAQQRVGKSGSMYYEGIEGAPLKIEVGMPEGNMIMEVTELSKSNLSDSEFAIPSDFKEVKGTF